MMDDLISRQELLKSMTNAIWHYPNEMYAQLNSYEMAEALAKDGLMFIPSAQPNVHDFPKDADCISRQAAIDALKNRWKKTRNYEGIGDDIAEECELYLKQVPSAQQWIPCSERLPEKIGDYLVSVKRHGWNCEEYIENDIAYWDDLEGFHKEEEVLAWMPLPEPYKGEE